MTVAEAAWAAGFIDGEGYLRITPAGQPWISVTNTSRQALERLRDLFGGSIYSHGNEKQGWTESWAWAVHGRRGARRVLEAVGPHLLVKADAAEQLQAVLA